MNYQSHMVDVSREAANEFFRYARAVPADKLTWKPLDAGRSVLDMCQEIAMTPSWAYEVLTKDKFEWDPEKAATQKKEMEKWATIADCEKQFDERFKKLAELYVSIPDAKLEETKWLPFNGGRDHTFREMLDYPRWNCNYHLGQVGYIQTLYGDREMY